MESIREKDFLKLSRPGLCQYLTLRDGQKIRTMHWPARKNSKGIVILVNGHREYIEKYDEFIEDFLERDFGLYTLDNRGQGLSDRILEDRRKSHAENFDFFIHDIDEFITRIVLQDSYANMVPLYLIGHSMGGHICLRYLHDFPNRIDKAVLMAPMMGLYVGKNGFHHLLRFFMKQACHVELGKNFAPGQKPFSNRHPNHILRYFLTHDPKRYAREARLIDGNPDLYVGGATYGWLKEAFKSMEKIQQEGYVQEISTPILTILAGKDRLVDNKAAIKILSKLPAGSCCQIENARHELYREADPYRNQLWHKMTEFLNID